MTQARVWDLEGWKSPLKVSELKTKPGIGYFAVSYRNFDLAYDAEGKLWVRSDVALTPSPKGAWEGYVVQASSSPEGIVLHIPETVHNYIGERSNGKAYVPVAKVVKRRVTSPAEKVEAAPGVDVMKTAGWQVVPLTALGTQIGTAKVTWGNGVVEINLMDLHGALKTYVSVNGFKLNVSPSGTTVALER